MKTLLLLFAASFSLDDALTRIRANVAIFENQVPDFICTEKITSRRAGDEKAIVVASTFSGRQNRSALRRLGGLSFIEERQVETVNGAPSKDKAMPKEMFRVGGAYTSIPATVFGSKAGDRYSFSMEDGIVAFTSKKADFRVKGPDGVHAVKTSGRAWFDPSTFEVTRIEFSLGEIPLNIEYQPVRIGDATFRMPSRVTAAGHGHEFLAEYTNYRKYGSTTNIQFGDEAK